MKIAHCIESSQLEKGGGVGQVVWTLSNCFIRAGHQVEVLSYDGQGPGSDKRSHGVPIKKIEILGVTKHSCLSLLIYRLGKNLLSPKLYQLLFSYCASWQLQKYYLSPGRYDIIFFHSVGFPYFIRIKRPHIIVFHGRYFPAPRQRIKTMLYRGFFRAVMRNKIVFTVSERLRQKVIRYCKVNPDKVHCVYNPVEAKKIRSLASKEVPQNIPKPYIISVARLAKDKTPDVLIRAYAESGVQHQLVMLGEGPLRGKLQALARRLGVENKVQFLGHRDNPFPYIKNAELLVLSSEEEGLGLVIAEAMVCGTKVVATRTDGACEIMGEEAEDCLAPIGDHHALADKIRSALKTDKPLKPKLDRRFEAQRVAQTYLHYAQRYCIKEGD